MRAIAWVLAVPMLVAAETPQPRLVRASGEAVVPVKPDRARIDIGVVTEAATAADAASRNAAASAAVLEKYKPLVAGAGTLRTAQYSLEPRYVYQRNEAPRIAGYRASNTVEVTLDEISRIGAVIDAAAGAGSNEIRSIRFELKDDTAARQEALRQAARRARANAQAIADALGLKVTGVEEASSGGAAARPVPMAASMAMSAGAATHVETGDIEVSATVTVALEVER